MAYGVARTKKQKDEMIEMLKPYLSMGMSITKACKSAGLPVSTITDYIRLDDKQGGAVRLKIGVWQNIVSTRARYNIVQSIIGGSIKSSKWWLDKTSFGKESDKVERKTGLTVEQLRRRDEALSWLSDTS